MRWRVIEWMMIHGWTFVDGCWLMAQSMIWVVVDLMVLCEVGGQRSTWMRMRRARRTVGWRPRRAHRHRPVDEGRARRQSSYWAGGHALVSFAHAWQRGDVVDSQRRLRSVRSIGGDSPGRCQSLRHAGGSLDLPDLVRFERRARERLGEVCDSGGIVALDHRSRAVTVVVRGERTRRRSIRFKLNIGSVRMSVHAV